MTFAFNALGEYLRQFCDAEDGIVTTDWIILTGAIMGAALAGVTSVRTGVADLGVGIESSLTSADVAMILTGNTLAAPLRWTEVSMFHTAGTKCPPAPNLCPNYTPPTTWEHAMLELDDGTFVERVSITTHGGDTKSDPVIEWRDEDGNTIDAPKEVPDLDMNSFDCDKYGDRCTLAQSTPKK
jgi:hypothetical protein